MATLQLKRALIERVTELWRAFFFPISPLEVAFDGVKLLRLVIKLVQMLLCQYQLNSGRSTACM